MSTLSVVIPATNQPPTLDRCLAAIDAAADGPEEVVVVDGPAALSASAARNVGARRAHGDVIVFVDSDVEVHADTFTRLRAALAGPGAPSAVFGSYDDAPDHPGVVSRFRNLLHHHVHQHGAGPAETFWTGLGAVERDAFLAVGGFDEQRYPHPSIEDIDLGARLVAAGARVELDPAIQGTHLKEWTLRSMLFTDLFRRGIPWVALQVRSGRPTTTLNCGWRHCASALVLVAVLVATALWQPVLVVGAVAAFLGLNVGFHGLLVRQLGVLHGAAGVVLHGLHHLIAVLAVPLGVAVAVAAALAALRAGTRPRPGHGGGVNVRLALVGCGRLAELGYLPAVDRCDGVDLVAVADPDDGRRDPVVASAGVAGHPDLRSLLAVHDVDAVVIASPAHAHLADTRLATDAGCAVLVEKPPAPDVEDTARLAALGPSVRVGFNRRFDPGVRAVRASIPAEGPLELDLRAQYRRSSWAPHTVRDDVLADLGPHLVDLARWLTASDVLAVTTRTLTDDVAELELRLGRGWARISCAADRYHAEHVVVAGAGAGGDAIGEHRVGGPVAAVTDRVGAVVARLRGADRPHPLVVSLAAQLAALAHTLVHPTPPRLVSGTATQLTDRVTRPAGVGGAEQPDDLGTGADGLAVMQVLDAARRSAVDAGRPVHLTAHTPERHPC